MAENTEISWCDHTFNAWVGCTKVSAACDHCYAEGWAKRTGHGALWNGERRRTSESNWRQPLKWNKAAEGAERRPRVFCASLADVFDNQAEPEWRADLWRLIQTTPNLDWLLLTKRPQNIAKMLPPDWGSGYPNVWLGTTCENQEEAERRIPHLRDVPARIRFLSCEPMLGRLDLDLLLYQPCPNWSDDIPMDMTTGLRECCSGCDYTGFDSGELAIHWVIAGGESGPGARPMHPTWARSLRDQCAEAGVPFHFKQWGEWLPGLGDMGLFIHFADGSSRATSRKTHDFGHGYLAERVGKKRAGRELDGQIHHGFPA